MASKNKVYWCNNGWQPYPFAFCPTKKAWDREMKAIGETAPYPTSDGCVTHFSRKKGGVGFSLVTITDRPMPLTTLLGVFVHEATHVWQEILYQIGETKPSSEFEAYSIQAIVQGLIEAWNRTGRGTIG